MRESAKSFQFNANKTYIKELINEGYAAEQIAKTFKWSSHFLRQQVKLKLALIYTEKLLQNGRARMRRKANAEDVYRTASAPAPGQSTGTY